MPSSSPNVLITVNGIPSVCVSNCTYQFLVNTPEVTYQALSGSVVSINLSNPSVINYTTSQLTVTLDGQPCTITSGTFDSFHCQMPTNTDASPVIRAGVYNSSVLLDGVGLLHLQDTVQPINYGLTINSVTPNSGGTNGGYVISLIGNGYPSDPLEANITLCGSQVTITHI